MSLPTTPARDAAVAKFSQRPYSVLALDIDTCTLTFGTSPCLATGEPCYNTIKSCKYKSAYTRGTRTIKFTKRGANIPAGEPLRPYIVSEETVPAAIDIEAGLARRGMVKFVLADEPCPDIEDDRYYAQRAAPAGSTYWARFLARNPNYAGRNARLMRGFDVAPWDWNTFITEQYIIEQITLNNNGTATITAKDPLKLTDRQKIPFPTTGRLTVDFKAIEATGYAVSATVTTIQLDSKASPLDGVYNGMEVYIVGNTGLGQRGTISGYVGVTRTATLITSWLVVPDTTSIYQVSALQLSLATGTGTQYADPATSGKREFVSIGDEVIEYTSKAGDVLKWATSDMRGVFGSKRSDHKTNDNVQIARAFINLPINTVVKQLLNEGGILDAQIDLAQIDNEINDYYGAAFTVYSCLTKPEDASKLLSELLSHIGFAGYFLPQDNKVHVVSCLPRLGTPVTWTDDHIKAGSLSVETLDSLRISHSMARIGKINHAGSDSDAANFGGVAGNIDAASLSLSEYGDVRPDLFYSRWFSKEMWEEVLIVCSRRVQQRRDAPKRITLQISARDFTVALGETVILDTDMLVDFSGSNLKPRCIVTKISEAKGEVELRVMNWSYRPAFIAPDTAGDYPLDIEYDHIAQDDGLMPDNTQGYAII